MPSKYSTNNRQTEICTLNETIPVMCSFSTCYDAAAATRHVHCISQSGVELYVHLIHIGISPYIGCWCVWNSIKTVCSKRRVLCNNNV